MTFAQARAKEQYLISTYSLKKVGENRINSISPKNKNLPAYTVALSDYLYNQLSNEAYMLIELFPGG